MTITPVLIVSRTFVIASLVLNSAVDMDHFEDPVITITTEACTVNILEMSRGHQLSAPRAAKSVKALALMIMKASSTESTHVSEAVTVRVGESLSLKAADSASGSSLLSTVCSNLLGPVFRASGTVWQVLIETNDMYSEASILFCNVHEYCRVIAGPAVKSTVGLLVAK
jgi:hypothetical protein